jgi:SsrA-binding protein
MEPMTQKSSELASNKRAFHEYQILETFEAGIILQGTEVKSLRDHGGNLQDSYVKATEGELWLVGCSIAPYRFGNLNNHEERRDRKLLMHKREISRLKESVQQKGFTIIPLSFYLKEGRVKVKLGLAKGKTKYDKRETIKTRDEERRMQKMLRSHG